MVCTKFYWNSVAGSEKVDLKKNPYTFSLYAIISLCWRVTHFIQRIVYAHLEKRWKC
jgi:hypothetical protein